MKLHREARRHFWAVNAALLCLAALVHAQAVASVLALRVAASVAPLAPSRVTPRTPSDAPSPVARDALTLLARNPFDSVTGPLAGRAIAEDAEEMPAARQDGDPMHDPLCEGVKVVAIAASREPGWSLASFAPSDDRAGTDARPLLRRRGGEVAGKTVELIVGDRVWLSSGATRCQIPMFAPPSPPKAQGAAPSKRPKADPLTAELVSRIQRTSESSFRVERAVVDKVLENPAMLRVHSELAPDPRTGAGTVRLLGIKPDSLLGALGLADGDQLVTVDGIDVSDPEKALGAFSRLHDGRAISIVVSRGGRPLTLDYDIQ